MPNRLKQFWDYVRPPLVRFWGVVSRPVRAPWNLFFHPEPPEGAKFEDLEKVRFQFRLENRKAILDKGVLTLAVGLAAAGAAWLANDALERERTRNAGALEAARQKNTEILERYKTREARERFMLGKRLEAVQSFARAISGVSRVYFAYAQGDKREAKPGEARAEMREALATAREVLNGSSSLFGKNFNTDLTRYYESFSAVSKLPPADWPAYRTFFADMGVRFDDLAREVFAGVADADLTPMPFEDISYARRIEMKPKAYLDAHVAEWKRKTGLK